MFNIEFYEKNGRSELWDFLEDLRSKSKTNKDLRIQYKQIMLYIELLQNNGTRLPDNITKHIDDGIWELRPGNNRIFYFFFKTTPLFCFIIFAKRLRKLREWKLRRLNQSVPIIFQERNDIL